VINIEQTRQDKGLYRWKFLHNASGSVPMPASQREKREEVHIKSWAHSLVEACVSRIRQQKLNKGHSRAQLAILVLVSHCKMNN